MGLLGLAFGFWGCVREPRLWKGKMDVSDGAEVERDLHTKNCGLQALELGGLR